MNTYESIKLNNKNLHYYSNHKNQELDISTSHQFITITEKIPAKRLSTDHNKNENYDIIETLNFTKNMETGNKIITYHCDLTPKSKIDLTLTLNSQNFIKEGHIYFHTLKESTKKINGTYHINIMDGLYLTYIKVEYITRKGKKYSLTSHETDDKLLPAPELDYLIYKITNTINKYQQKNHKPVISFPFYLTSIFDRERKILEELKVIASESYSPENQVDINNLVTKYTNKPKLQRCLTKN